MLVAGLDPNARIPNCSVPTLFFAARHDDDGQLRMLIDHGVDLDLRDDEWDQTAAIHAAMAIRFDNVGVLLDAGADFTARDCNDVDVAYATIDCRFGPDHPQWRSS